MRILYITGGSPWPTNIGVNQRTNLIYQALSECGKVDLIINSAFVALDIEQIDNLTQNFGLIRIFNQARNNLGRWKSYSNSLVANLNNKCDDWFGTYLTDKEVENWIQNKIETEQYNLVVARYLKSAINTGVVNFSPIVLDVDDLKIDLVSAQATKKPSGSLKKIAWLGYRHIINLLEQKFLSKFEHLWFAKASDQAIVKSKNSSILPNIPFLNEKINSVHNTPGQKNNIALFVGSMRHHANVSGIDQFIRSSWPKIVTARKDAVLRVVGTGMTERQKREWNRSEGVEAIGFVEDIGAEYRQCTFSIIPLHEGGGTKIKLVESLAHERTCVVTAHAVRGYEGVLRDSEDISIAADDHAFVEKCIELFSDKCRRDAMAKHGKKIIEDRFSYDAFRSIVAATVSQVARSENTVRRR